MIRLRFIAFIILFFACSIGYGQKKDSVVFIGTDMGASGLVTDKGLLISVTNTGTTSGRPILIKASGETKQDTIPVIMLVCDTTWQKNMSSQLWLNDSYYDLGNRYSSVWWQFGYEVYERTPSCDKCLYQSIFIGYIDQNKKQLPSSIIVWMSKEIKN